MPKLTLRGVALRYFDVRRDEGGVFTRTHMSADYSSPVQEAMEWENLPGTVSQAKLAGRVILQSFVLTPNEKELAKANEIRLSALELSDFTYHHKEPGDDGESGRTEIRFILRTGDVEADFRLGQWLRNVGGGLGTLKVDYEQQEELDLQSGTEEEDTAA